VVLSRKAENLSSRHKRTINNDITFRHRQRETQIKILHHTDKGLITRVVNKVIYFENCNAMCDHRFGNFFLGGGMGKTG
jgi:hypothetical protein